MVFLILTIVVTDSQDNKLMPVFQVYLELVPTLEHLETMRPF